MNEAGPTTHEGRRAAIWLHPLLPIAFGLVFLVCIAVSFIKAGEPITAGYYEGETVAISDCGTTSNPDDDPGVRFVNAQMYKTDYESSGEQSPSEACASALDNQRGVATWWRIFAVVAVVAFASTIVGHYQHGRASPMTV